MQANNPFQGHTFVLNTMTESSMEGHFDGERGHFTIKMNNGKESRTVRRQYSAKFLNQFAGAGKWNENNLTQVLTGIFLLDPKGLINMTRTPRTCLSTLIDAYRKDFIMEGSLFYMDLKLTMDSISITSQRDPANSLSTPSVREITRQLFVPVMGVRMPPKSNNK